MQSRRILLVHRFYRQKGGEDYFVERVLEPALRELGIEVELLGFPPLGGKRPGVFAELLFMFLGWERLRPSYRAFVHKVAQFKPSHVIFNNVIPTVSLDAARAAYAAGAKTILWTHNSRAYCANGLSFNGRESCQKCWTEGSRFAFFQKCYPTWLQSLLYAWVYRGRRVERKLHAGIQQFVAVSDFTAERLAHALSGAKVQTIRNPPRITQLTADGEDLAVVARMEKELQNLPKRFYAFVGRISYEKGGDRFVELARRFPQFGFVMCGDGPQIGELGFPANLRHLGVLDQAALAWIYRHAAALIICSRVPENAPLVIVESHPYGIPVVYEPGGGAEESVRFFGRSGCSLEEFHGQAFERKARAFSGGEFARQLLELVGKAQT